MTPKFKLDQTDWRILYELQGDGRITNVELARRAGISPPPCLRRVRALEEQGLITGYRALLNAEQLGFELTMFAMQDLGIMPIHFQFTMWATKKGVQYTPRTDEYTLAFQFKPVERMAGAK